MTVHGSLKLWSSVLFHFIWWSFKQFNTTTVTWHSGDVFQYQCFSKNLVQIYLKVIYPATFNFTLSDIFWFIDFFVMYTWNSFVWFVCLFCHARKFMSFFSVTHFLYFFLSFSCLQVCRARENAIIHMWMLCIFLRFWIILIFCY